MNTKQYDVAEVHGNVEIYDYVAALVIDYSLQDKMCGDFVHGEIAFSCDITVQQWHVRQEPNMPIEEDLARAILEKFLIEQWIGIWEGRIG